METTQVTNETLLSLAELLKVEPSELGSAIHQFAAVDHRYIRDLKINLSNALKYSTLKPKESMLLALAAAINEKKETFIKAFTNLAREQEASDSEIADTYACVSLLNTNNVFYRFRHFTKTKEFYQNAPAGIKMSIMMNPVMGKEFFELMSICVSALNGCELCVSSHEESLLKLGTEPQRIFDAIKLTANLKGFLVIN